MTLEQIVADADYPECEQLCRCIKESGLINVAEVKGENSFAESLQWR